MYDLPKSIAIIMDGNRRWAKLRNQSSFYGHQKGAENVKKVINSCINYNIQELTLFGFSTENWKRFPIEITFLFAIIEKIINKEFK